jgi:hypothetical protein
MATRFTRRNHGKGHSYTIDGAKVPGVTTIIGILDKPALLDWAARETAAYADDHWAELSTLRSADRIERLTKARYATNRRAVVQGNRVHALGDRISRGEQIPTNEIPAELVSWVEAYARFLDAWDLEVLHTEMPVANTAYRYAGTLDAIAYSPRLGTILLDLKTGKGVYDEVALQLAAYRYCDLGIVQEQVTGPRGGVRTEDRQIPVPAVDETWVAHLHESSVEFRPVQGDAETYDTFLFMAEVYDRWVRRTSWKNRDDEDALRTIGAPAYPEDYPIKETR